MPLFVQTSRQRSRSSALRIQLRMPVDKTMHGIQALVWKLRRVVALGRLNCRTTELIFLLLELAVYRVTRRLEPE